MLAKVVIDLLIEEQPSVGSLYPAADIRAGLRAVCVLYRNKEETLCGSSISSPVPDHRRQLAR